MSTWEGDALRDEIETAALMEGLTLDNLTVESLAADPYRLDTEMNHTNGAWLRERMDALGIRALHPRGIHYRLIGSTKPNGDEYKNNTFNSDYWLPGVITTARWLGYVPWEWVLDERNAEPILRTWKPADVTVEIEADRTAEGATGEVREWLPDSHVYGAKANQPYKIAIFGEKSSLRPVLSTLAARFDAALFVTGGDISDTLMFQMAQMGDHDGRPLVVVTVSDCDPSGWTMPVIIGRKLQAFKTLSFPDLDFTVVRAGLTPAQVKAYNLDHPDAALPTSVVKEGDLRGEQWRAVTAQEQTEVDAVLAFAPDLIGQWVEEAVEPFFDADLNGQVDQALSDWYDEVDNDVILDVIGDVDDRTSIAGRITERVGYARLWLDEAERFADAAIEQITARTPAFTLPETDMDSTELPVPAGYREENLVAQTVLVNSQVEDWTGQTYRLIRSKWVCSKGVGISGYNKYVKSRRNPTGRGPGRPRKVVE